MSLIAAAVNHLRATGNLDEAVEIALGKRQVNEGLQPSVQTQVWFCPNENAVNQLVLWVQNRLGIKASKIEPYSNGAQGGYAVTFTGVMNPHDIASLASRYGCMALSGASMPGALQ